MLKTEIEESEMVDYFLQSLNLTDDLDELEKIRIAKKILRIYNGIPINDEEPLNKQYDALKDRLKINEKYYMSLTMGDIAKGNQMKIYGNIGIKKTKHAISTDKLNKVAYDEMKTIKKQLTYEPAVECDLELDVIMKGDIKLEREPKLVFLRFFGKAENIGLKHYNDAYFNTIDFLAKDKEVIPKIDSLQTNKYYQTHYYQKNKKSEIRFYSDFMGGNLWKVYETTTDNFDVYTNIETNNTLPNYWFYFRVVYAGSKESKQVVMNLQNINLGINDKHVNIWIKRKNNGISNYNKIQRSNRKRPRKFVGETPTNQENIEAFYGWDNSLRALIVKNEDNNSMGLRFTLNLKKNEDCYIALSYPYFMSTFFTELKLHTHPLFNAAEFKHTKTKFNKSDLV